MTVSEPTSAAPTPHVPTVTAPRFEHHRETLGTGERAPRLSWLTETAAPGWRQAAYEIERAGPGDQGDETTGRVASGESVLVPWPFAPLASRERVTVRVRVWGEDESVSEWSEPAAAEVGLLSPEDWTARPVAPDRKEDLTRPQPAPLLRREFDVRAGVVRARLYLTAQGVYEAGLNGVRVGDHVLAPGWTSYDHRLRYQTFDVTGLLREGRNALGATLGDGWYRGKLGFGGGRRNLYGTDLALLAQLEIEYADGGIERVVTDETWRSSTGPILGSDIYDGETYDARLERPGWLSSGYDDRDWGGVKAVERDLGTLVAPLGPPVRRIQTVLPVAITRSPSGKTLVDFGQNLVGWVRLTVRGEAGQTVTLRHAEVLEHGELGTRPLRHAAATDRYTLKGGGEETWEPRFTFHGFRYAEVEGWPGELTLDDLVAVVVHSDLERTGTFECSDLLLNQLHQNVVWGMRGNFLDLPTDCPQRDERLGWTGDIQVFSPTASFLYDVSGFLSSWLADLAAEQTGDGVVPFVVPNTQGEMALTPMTAWGDAAVIVPWVLYQRFGDTGILERQFGSMRAWVDHLGRLTGERRLWDKGFQFGDWLDPSAPPERPGAARTQPGVVATAYFARSAELVGLTAGVLGRAEDEAKYHALAAEVRQAFEREYVTPNGRVISDATTAYALALQFGLLPTGEGRRHAGQRLADLVRDSRYRVSTGFVGTPLICDALTGVGAYDAAYRLLTERECPSWLYPVTMGATTIWERWDSMLPDGSINPGEMTSFNHYALGAVADWMHRTVAGLAPAEPGYRRLEIRPLPGGDLTHARARHRTPYGWAEAGWRVVDGQFTLETTIPANTAARVTLPGGETHEVGSGPHRWTVPLPARAARPPLTLDSTLNELVDDPEAYRLFMRLVREHAPDVADHMAGGVGGAGDRPIRRGLFMMPRVGKFLPKLEAALAELRR